MTLTRGHKVYTPRGHLLGEGSRVLEGVIDRLGRGLELLDEHLEPQFVVVAGIPQHRVTGDCGAIVR